MISDSKKGRPPPNWLKTLPKGKYTALQLQTMFNRDKDSIRKVLKRHGVTIEYEKIYGKIIAYYIWNGF